MKSALFQPGRILVTPAAVRAMRQAAAQPEDYLQRHFSGNWGFVSTKDRHANESAVREGRRIISAYRLNDGTQVLIITEGDRSATTILLPEDCTPHGQIIRSV
jgi:hypothetical protein